MAQQPQQEEEQFFAISAGELQTILNTLMSLKGEVSPGDVILPYEILKNAGQRILEGYQPPNQQQVAGSPLVENTAELVDSDTH